jgi:5-methyltetrahydrofolate--homocysteine methyltransferase
VYNGKPAVNSVNGEPEVMERILPLVKKYGASVVGLTLDSKGIPQTAEGRVEIAERILATAKECGVPCLGFDEL